MGRVTSGKRVDARVIRPHDRGCDSRWKLDSRWGLGDTDKISIVLYDELGRRNNGGRVFYVMCCTATYRCRAEAIVSKGFLHEQAIGLLEGGEA